VLETQNLTFSYTPQKIILQSIDFQLKRGEIVLLSGRTGSGKSTLARILSGFIPRAIDGEISGTYLINDKDVTDHSIPDIANIVSLVQQDPESQICTLKVFDEVAFGPENYLTLTEEIDELVKRSLEATKIAHLTERPTFALSGGEMQRLAISSMLACQSDYLILDEPSSSLDPTGASELRRVLLELKERNLGILVIEHNLAAILPIADRTLNIENGKLSESTPKITQSSHLSAESTEPGAPLLVAEDIHFSYGDRLVVKAASITLHQNEIVALMGDNGSGKTTFLNILGGLMPPSRGELYLEGVPLDRKNLSERIRKISVVFQNPNHQIFERTVWAEQTLTLETLKQNNELLQKRAEELLDAACLTETKEQNPFSLSHGQKRRLNVSSSMVHSPTIYLFDEPFIGQDQEGRDFIITTIKQRTETNGAAIVVTHDPDFALRQSNRIVFMEAGRVLLDGPPSTVMNRLDELGMSEYSEAVVSR
jgi:energy-coupling factor transport system ATP-binding protein